MAKNNETEIPDVKDLPGEDTDSDVTPDERAVLENIDYRKAESEDQPLIEGQLDETDEDGDPLNESDELSGKDLDVPGTEDDDTDEDMGEEDEENNEYSLNDDNGDLNDDDGK